MTTMSVRDVSKFAAIFFALWIAAWLLHEALPGRSHSDQLGGSRTVDTLFWIVAKVVIWIGWPVLYFRSRVPDLAAFAGLRGIGLGRATVQATFAASVWIAASLVFAETSGQSLHSAAQSWLLVLYTVVFTPVVEEFVFRGALLPGLLAAGWRFRVANLTVTLLFVLAHVVGWRFQGNLGPNLRSTSVFSLIALSLYLGWIRHRTQSLTASILVHSANNFWSEFVT